MRVIDIFVTGVGLLMSFGYYPQAWRMYQTRSAESVSAVSFAILALGTTTWTLYGIYLRSTVIIGSFVFGMIGSWLVLWFIWRYRTSRSHPTSTHTNT